MALTFSISFLEQNDNLALQLTDDTGTYHAVDNPTGWTAPWAEVTDIVASDDVTPAKYHLLLDVTYTGSDAVSVVYDQLNLYDLNGGAFADASELVFLIDAADLVDSVTGIAMGTDETPMLDGKYDFTYKLADNVSGVVATTFSESILLDGNVRVKIYNQLREIPTIYDSTELFVPIYHHDFRDILVTLLKKGMFDGMLANVSDARADEVLNTLDVIERLTIND